MEMKCSRLSMSKGMSWEKPLVAIAIRAVNFCTRWCIYMCVMPQAGCICRNAL